MKGELHLSVMFLEKNPKKKIVEVNIFTSLLKQN